MEAIVNLLIKVSFFIRYFNTLEIITNIALGHTRLTYIKGKIGLFCRLEISLRACLSEHLQQVF